jgi:precorrin-6B C5,15-methyltransferase / cobalt-precorrin-6B C5,C15-methyltransferase
MRLLEPIAVIGIGAGGAGDLGLEAREHLRRAAVLAGGARHLSYFPGWSGERVVIDADIDRALCQIKGYATTQKVVVLASGDPLFYGIGRALLAAFASEDLLFLPHLNSVQLAFARLKQPWHDACVVSVHGRPLHALSAALQRGETKIAVLTDARNDPRAVARLLDETGFSEDYALWLCEELGAADERIIQVSAGSLAMMDISPLNLVVLLKTGNQAKHAAPVLGIPERDLQHIAVQRGLITKREIRLLTLCQLELRPSEVLWDIGAGSGSVAIEAARLAPSLRAFALEKNEAAWHNLEDNVRRFGLTNVETLHGEAPDALAALPTPDAVFIGGSGGRLPDILQTVFARLQPGGRLVMNCIAIESLAQLWTWLTAHDCEPEVLNVQLGRSRALGSLHCLDADSPIAIVKACKI